MRPIVFAGPSLPPSLRHRWPDLAFRPPAQQGDLYRAAQTGPPAIALIDGYFESVPSVWHKEILWTLSQGIPVLGASSMGALRAAELSAFGMIGIGRVFEYFQMPLRDDADVAVLHGPMELDYPVMSEAQVNVVFTLEAASAAGVITAAEASLLCEVSAAIFFKRRSYAAILRQAHAESLALATRRRLTKHLKAGRIDQKRADAIVAMDRMRESWPKPIPFNFQKTAMWDAVA